MANPDAVGIMNPAFFEGKKKAYTMGE